ncbi:signal peptidase I [Veronia pacifica]|uniref:Signal peptidase I n=1 Tax=Veronia pacifica TaxID=1080227 RepID=A0A1C3EKY6_9GAMM|nr:signal peptidase I [Veronia pacifica]ODA33896.1 signal peptidase I [Veronia pacifica]
MKKKWHDIYLEYRSLLIFILLMTVFRSSFADWNHVPTGSMKPTIQIGDRILVNKMAYDLRIPFTGFSLYTFSDPERGDIVTFESEVTGNNMVKRVIGIPGDIIAMVDNRLYINGAPMTYHQTSTQGPIQFFEETTRNGHYQIRINREHSPASNFKAVEVPQGHYLMLGDNRDNSADSRFIGFVPRKEIRGRTRSVVMSFDYDNYFIPRAERFLRTL